jgi:hypothetical protein
MGNPQFIIGAVLPAAALMLRAGDGIPGCGLVTAIGANSRHCGLKVSGLASRWFTAPVDVPTGVLHPGASIAETAPGCGDSFLAECAGFGASVLPVAPAFCPMIGASVHDAIRYAEGAHRIALGEHPHYKIPVLGFRGAPVGVDARKVVETGTLPVIDIMMVHKTPGTGLVGMGIVRPPMSCFEQAVQALQTAQT